MLPALLILTAGLLYSYFNPNNFILITTVALAGLITLPCLIVVAVGDAEKRAKKRKQKQQLDDDEFSPEAKERLIKSLDEKYQTIISKNNEMTAKVSSLFTSPDALEEFMSYINKELTDASKADGCVILMLDEYDNIHNKYRLLPGFFLRSSPVHPEDQKGYPVLHVRKQVRRCFP